MNNQEIKYFVENYLLKKDDLVPVFHVNEQSFNSVEEAITSTAVDCGFTVFSVPTPNIAEFDYKLWLSSIETGNCLFLYKNPFSATVEKVKNEIFDMMKAYSTNEREIFKNIQLMAVQEFNEENLGFKSYLQQIIV